jgi:hypothetical protein
MTRFEGLAHSWLRLAEDLERAEALLERLKCGFADNVGLEALACQVAVLLGLHRG